MVAVFVLTNFDFFFFKCEKSGQNDVIPVWSSGACERVEMLTGLWLELSSRLKAALPPLPPSPHCSQTPEGGNQAAAWGSSHASNVRSVDSVRLQGDCPRPCTSPKCDIFAALICSDLLYDFPETQSVVVFLIILNCILSLRSANNDNKCWSFCLLDFTYPYMCWLCWFLKLKAIFLPCRFSLLNRPTTKILFIDINYLY